MNERPQLIVVAGGGLVLATLAAAQERIGRVGMLTWCDAGLYHQVTRAGFIAGLREQGYIECKNLELIQRSADFDPNRFKPLTRELVQAKVDVVFAPATLVATAAWYAEAEYLRDIHSSGQPLLTLVNNVLDLSKIEAGKLGLDLPCYDLGLLLAHSTTLVRERAQRHGLALTLEVGDGLGEWVADARKLKQAVVNLLSNAVKFTPTGGTVTVRARHLNGVSGRSGDWAEVLVIDSGIGIKPDDQALVFEEFRQASGDVLSKSEGTGLGLALVKRFVELHGGQIALASAPVQGLTFTITLPALQAELQAAREETLH